MKKYRREDCSTEHRFSHQISITSKTGVGGSTLYHRLAGRLQKMPFRFASVGDWIREEARAKGFAVFEEYVGYIADHPEEKIDERFDGMIREFARHNYMVGEGRLPHIFMPHAFHVLLVCDPEIRAERRRKDKGISKDEVLHAILKRDGQDDGRYEKLYPGSLWPEDDFDLVLDTGTYSEEHVEEAVIEKHTSWVRRNSRSIVTDALISAP